jgi:hypothetical protein
MPRPAAPAVALTNDERVQLIAWTRRAKSANALAMRARIVLAVADGLGNTASRPSSAWRRARLAVAGSVLGGAAEGVAG